MACRLCYRLSQRTKPRTYFYQYISGFRSYSFNYAPDNLRVVQEILAEALTGAMALMYIVSHAKSSF